MKFEGEVQQEETRRSKADLLIKAWEVLHLVRTPPPTIAGSRYIYDVWAGGRSKGTVRRPKDRRHDP
jgi:hypothetical protein